MSSLTVAESLEILRPGVVLTVLTEADLDLLIAVTISAAQGDGGVAIAGYQVGPDRDLQSVSCKTLLFFWGKL